MIARCAVLLLLAAGWGWGATDTVVTTRLATELKNAHPYVTPATVEEVPMVNGEFVLTLEPMAVTASRSFAVDILAEARRAAAAREAERFSLTKGGSLLSFRRGDIGFWPEIVPINATPVRKGDVGIKVDLLRIKW